jgi:hypothetical protein
MATYVLPCGNTIEKEAVDPSVSKEGVESFHCSICREYVEIDYSRRFKVASCEIPNHLFCTICIASYVEHSILSQGQINGLPCPLNAIEQCNGLLSEKEMESLVSEGVANRYRYLKEMRSHPNNRECPECHNIVLGVGASKPDMECTGCRAKFCFEHSNAHPNESCANYQRRTSLAFDDHEKLTKKFISNNTKKCPFCYVSTEKNGGCNHMHCSSCNKDWCWLCGYEMGPGHYDEVVGLCPGTHFLNYAIKNTYTFVTSSILGAQFSDTRQAHVLDGVTAFVSPIILGREIHPAGFQGIVWKLPFFMISSVQYLGIILGEHLQYQFYNNILSVNIYRSCMLMFMFQDGWCLQPSRTQ